MGNIKLRMERIRTEAFSELIYLGLYINNKKRRIRKYAMNFGVVKFKLKCENVIDKKIINLLERSKNDSAYECMV